MIAEKFPFLRRAGLFPALLVGVLLSYLLFEVWSHPERMMTRDSSSYLIPATSFLQTGEFRDASGALDPLRTPGYPMLLALGVAAGELLLTPHWIVYSFLLLSEMLFTVVMTAATLLLLKYRTKQTSGWLITGTLLLGLLPPALLLVLTLVWHRQDRQSESRKKRWAPSQIAISLLLSALLLLPTLGWMERNHRAHQLFALSSVSSINLFYYLSADLQARSEHRLLSEVQEGKQVLEEEWIAAHPHHTWGERAAFLSNSAKEQLWENPWKTVESQIKSVSAIFIPEVAQLLELLGKTEGSRGSLSVLHRDGVLAAMRHYLEGSSGTLFWMGVVVLWTALFYLAFLLSLLQMIRQKNWRDPHWILLGFALLQIVASGVANPRFLTAPLPFLMLIAVRFFRSPQQELS